MKIFNDYNKHLLIDVEDISKESVEQKKRQKRLVLYKFLRIMMFSNYLQKYSILQLDVDKLTFFYKTLFFIRKRITFNKYAVSYLEDYFKKVQTPSKELLGIMENDLGYPEKNLRVS